jgi:hypothetical protein
MWNIIKIKTCLLDDFESTPNHQTSFISHQMLTDDVASTISKEDRRAAHEEPIILNPTTETCNPPQLDVPNRTILPVASSNTNSEWEKEREDYKELKGKVENLEKEREDYKELKGKVENLFSLNKTPQNNKIPTTPNIQNCQQEEESPAKGKNNSAFSDV